jgi:hypothetical protein
MKHLNHFGSQTSGQVAQNKEQSHAEQLNTHTHPFSKSPFSNCLGENKNSSSGSASSNAVNCSFTTKNIVDRIHIAKFNQSHSFSLQRKKGKKNRSQHLSHSSKKNFPCKAFHTNLKKKNTEPRSYKRTDKTVKVVREEGKERITVKPLYNVHSGTSIKCALKVLLTLFEQNFYKLPHFPRFQEWY